MDTRVPPGGVGGAPLVDFAGGGSGATADPNTLWAQAIGAVQGGGAGFRSGLSDAAALSVVARVPVAPAPEATGGIPTPSLVQSGASASVGTTGDAFASSGVEGGAPAFDLAAASAELHRILGTGAHDDPEALRSLFESLSALGPEGVALAEIVAARMQFVEESRAARQLAVSDFAVNEIGNLDLTDAVTNKFSPLSNPLSSSKEGKMFEEDDEEDA